MSRIFLINWLKQSHPEILWGPFSFENFFKNFFRGNFFTLTFGSLLTKVPKLKSQGSLKGQVSHLAKRLLHKSIGP